MAKGYALHIGINKYGSPIFKDLRNPCNDANSMRQITKSQQRFDKVSILTDSQVTLGNIVCGLLYYSQITQPGDIFVFTYAGHGTHTSPFRDYQYSQNQFNQRYLLSNGDENRNQYEFNHIKKRWYRMSDIDAAIVIPDKTLLSDDILTLLLKCFKPGVRIVTIFDACESATMVDLNPKPLTDMGMFNLHQKLLTSPNARASQRNYDFIARMIDVLEHANELNMRAGLISMSAVFEEDQAKDSHPYEPSNNGFFTHTLLKVWNQGRFSGNYFDFHSEIFDTIRSELRALEEHLSPENLEILLSSTNSVNFGDYMNKLSPYIHTDFAENVRGFKQQSPFEI